MKKILTVVGSLLMFCSVGMAEMRTVGVISDTNGSTSVTVNLSTLNTDPQHPGAFVYGIQGDVTLNTTITFYGYLDSYVVSSNGSNSTFSTNFASGTKIITSGSSVGDNMNIAVRNPSVFTVNVGTGATVGYILKGTFYR